MASTRPPDRSVLLEPFLTRCGSCRWSIAVETAEEKERREKVHSEHAHGVTVAAVTELMTADPTHTADTETIIGAIVFDARANDGEVNPNRVRGLLPSWVLPQQIGAVYNSLSRQGRLVQVGWTTNTDQRGRNVGKPIALYEYREAS